MNRTDFWALYSGKRRVIGYALINHDAFDQFGWVQGWRFAICDYLYFECGEYVPEFRPASEPEFSFEYEEIAHNEPDTEALLYALEILDRYREWLRIAGLDY